MGRKLTIEQMQAIAKKRGGKCLSKRYVNSATKLKWKCKNGHQWKAVPRSIKNNGSWCLECSGSKKHTIEEMQAIAKSRGGKCLSKRYVNSNTRLEWECKYGHRWKATPSKIKNSNRWCTECSSGISERICRSFFRQLFEKPFPKSRPRWLKNKFGHQMELDGYCKELKIAFEHQGEQHYSIRTQFINTNAELLQRQEDDKDKLSLCKQNGVRLIAIPQLFSKSKLDNLQQYIYEECKRLRIRRPAGMLEKTINFQSAWISPRTETIFKELQSIAEKRGGKCLSKKYVNEDFKLEFACKYGHRWKASPGKIRGKRKQWCPQCAGNKKLTIEEMHAIAKSRGGKCLSKKYINNNTYLKWECKKGHNWSAVPLSIIKGSWCAQCAGKKKLTIEKMESIAKSRGGKCLSKKYINNNTYLKWECEQGHQWKASPKTIKRGSWCPKCKKK